MMSKLIEIRFNEIKSFDGLIGVQQVIQINSRKSCLIEFNLLNLYSSVDLKG